ncbi:MAG: hypothetical protein WBE48_00710 [Xanthobacteraceae bacterium]
MSEEGFIAVARGILDHPIVGARKPFSYFEAWIWLLSKARWASGRIHVANGHGANIVNLERGQVSHSLRYMATAWGWKIKRVRTFLRRLETDTQIGTQTGTGQTVITICNYNQYQNLPSARGTSAGTPTGTRRAQRETKEPNKKDIPANAGSSSGSKYAFEAGVIRLTEKDFGQWQTAFSNLDLRAELIALRPWAEEQGKGRWFNAVANALAKRNREAKIAIERSKGDAAFKWNGIEGVI